MIQDGLCDLLIYVPFTSRGRAAKCLSEPCGNPGFSQMAAAFLAMDVFNRRDGTVVPELDQSVFQDCNIYMDNTSRNNTRVADTESYRHAAALHFVEQTQSSGRKLPCAITGAWNDMPALELSVLALTHRIPLTVHRAFNWRVVSPDFSPFTTQVYPDLLSSVNFLVNYLRYRERNNYVSVLYAMTDTGTQRSVAFDLAFKDANIRNQIISYESPAQGSVHKSSSRSIRAAVQQAKDSGYRTFVLAPETLHLELPILADAAEEYGLNSGDYFWIMFGDADGKILTDENTNITKLVQGATWLGPVEPLGHNQTSPTFLAWQSQGQKEVDRLNVINPIAKNEPGYYFAEADFFQSIEPDYGDSYAFDAVMSTAMGACLAAANATNETEVSGVEHLGGIRAVNFAGASGRIAFESGPMVSGGRLGSTVTWGVFNMIPNSGYTHSTGVSGVQMTEIYDKGVWRKTPFTYIYADGTNNPPPLLRDIPNQNYLNPSIRIAGFVLMGILLFGSLLASAWIYLHREHRVLRASQPHFLYLLTVGSAVMASTIFAISFDESYGWSEEQLSRACTAIPWLMSMGQIFTYSSLFGKLWRINKVLQFSRRKVQIHQVAWPLAILAILALGILTTWTILGGLEWNRMEVDTMTGESIGECRSDYMAAFLSPLIILMLIPAILTAIMAWKTRDVDDSYSESKWIFLMIVAQIQVVLVSLPSIAILRDVSVDGRYLGFVFILWTFPSSALGFIIGPKWFAYRAAVSGSDSSSRKRGDARGNTRISGLVEGKEKNAGVDLAALVPKSSLTTSETRRTPELSSSSQNAPGPSRESQESAAEAAANMKEMLSS